MIAITDYTIPHTQYYHFAIEIAFWHIDTLPLNTHWALIIIIAIIAITFIIIIDTQNIISCRHYYYCHYHWCWHYLRFVAITLRLFPSRARWLLITYFLSLDAFAITFFHYCAFHYAITFLSLLFRCHYAMNITFIITHWYLRHYATYWFRHRFSHW